MSKFGLLNLAVKVLAKESLKNPYKAKKRLPAMVELLTGSTGYHTKTANNMDEFVELPKYVYNNKSKKMEVKGKERLYPDKKYRYQMHQPKRKENTELWRGETINPDEQFISKAGIEHAEPGSWYSPNVLESMNYAVRPWKGGMGNQKTNPGILRRVDVKDIKKANPNFNTQSGEILDHINLPQNLQLLSNISLIPTLIARLRQAGFKNANIIKTIKMILKKKKPSGAPDWKFYNKGGIASL
tara:strand:- start:64 stop:789 length:726 start_codon:yes stop_codon:yes gene_type:complete